MPASKRSVEAVAEGSRKRTKMTDSKSHAATSAIAPNFTTPSTTMQESDKDVASARSEGEAQKTLNLLHQDFDDLRQLVTCKICERLLYEPYALSCGHTYCYSCLNTWFGGNRKKTCPNCRVNITQLPAPSYVIKEMTTVFVKRAELLPDGETAEQHADWQREEAELVFNDRNNSDPRTGGLFKGCFSKHRVHLNPIHDPGDNVDRCPQCHWELEEGMCLQCGIHIDHDIFREPFESSDTDDFETTDEEVEDDDSHPIDGDHQFEADMAIIAGLGGHSPSSGDSDIHSTVPFSDAIGYAWGDEFEQEFEEEDTDLEGFIVDDNEAHIVSSSSISSDDVHPGGNGTESSAARPSNPPFRRPTMQRRVVMSSDDEEASSVHAAASSHQSDSESDSAPEVQSSRRVPFPQHRSRARPIAISSSDSDSEDNASGAQINGASTPSEVRNNDTAMRHVDGTDSDSENDDSSVESIHRSEIPGRQSLHFSSSEVDTSSNDSDVDDSDSDSESGSDDVSDDISDDDEGSETAREDSSSP